MPEARLARATALRASGRNSEARVQAMKRWHVTVPFKVSAGCAAPQASRREPQLWVQMEGSQRG
eukprot:10617555-Lingulodinium_polyedra.AAC.1